MAELRRSLGFAAAPLSALEESERIQLRDILKRMLAADETAHEAADETAHEAADGTADGTTDGEGAEGAGPLTR